MGQQRRGPDRRGESTTALSLLLYFVGVGDDHQTIAKRFSAPELGPWRGLCFSFGFVLVRGRRERIVRASARRNLRATRHSAINRWALGCHPSTRLFLDDAQWQGGDAASDE